MYSTIISSSLPPKKRVFPQKRPKNVVLHPKKTRVIAFLTGFNNPSTSQNIHPILFPSGFSTQKNVDIKELRHPESRNVKKRYLYRRTRPVFGDDVQYTHTCSTHVRPTKEPTSNSANIPSFIYLIDDVTGSETRQDSLREGG